MKSSMNGGLNLSVLDGWWPEAYDGGNGWAISGDVDDDHGAQDARDGAELYRLLEEEVVPGYYSRDDAGLPREWLARVKSSIANLGPVFNAHRMVTDYVSEAYGPRS
jgi:starch phosphorylase